jgi:antitoxin (DNA-binding transcriptional repressor) of toxin-antitoxin stability system
MTSVNVTILKAKLSEKLSEVREGESFVVTDRRVPIAKLVPIGTEAELLVERKASGPFKPVRSRYPDSVKLDSDSLLAAERGDR